MFSSRFHQQVSRRPGSAKPSSNSSSSGPGPGAYLQGHGPSVIRAGHNSSSSVVDFSKTTGWPVGSSRHGKAPGNRPKTAPLAGGGQGGLQWLLQLEGLTPPALGHASVPIEASGLPRSSGRCSEQVGLEEELQPDYAAAAGALGAPVHMTAQEALPYAKSQNSHFKQSLSQNAGAQQQHVVPFPYCVSHQGPGSIAPTEFGPGPLLVRGNFRTRPASAPATAISTAGAHCTYLAGEALGAAATPEAAADTSPIKQLQLRDGLSLEHLAQYSSTGFAQRVPGGGFSTGSRSAAAACLRVMGVGSVVPPATAGVRSAGTELKYDPRDEALGHRRKAPAWQLPPNRTAMSAKRIGELRRAAQEVASRRQQQVEDSPD
jgi:hypothetical protein